MSDGLKQQSDSRGSADVVAGGIPSSRRSTSPILGALAPLLLALGAAAVLRAHACSSPVMAAVGGGAPDFDLPVLGQPTQRVTLRSLRGHPVVLVFNCGCQACNEFDRSLAASIPPSSHVRVLAVTVNPSAYEGEELTRFRKSSGVLWPILVDGQLRTAIRYRSTDCPRAWLIDREGVIRRQAPSPGEQPTEAVHGLAAALRAL